MDYKASGVDIDAGNDTVNRIKSLARGTFTPGVLSEIGSFGGLFQLDRNRFQEPDLVSSADGVGTKLKVASMTGRHDPIGADLVNHCINDILVQGAEPLFFLDYLATGRLSPDVAEQIVGGIARACRENGCALIGGETAEMPGFYADGEYDVAGFIVGIVDRSRILDGKAIRHGDLLIGLPSVGLHTNGYSLARKVFFELAKLTPNSRVDDLEGTVGDELLKPHLNYEPIVRVALARNLVEGLAHITGGGITENLNRILPASWQAEVRPGSWPVLPLCQVMARLGGIERDEMLRSTNMGIGMVIVVRPSNLAALTATLSTPWYQIGQIIPGEPLVTYRS